MEPEDYYVYILTNSGNQVFYVGSTKNVTTRVSQHRKKSGAGFTKKYRVIKLVYFEKIQGYQEALQRERQLKRWRRTWKEQLIETKNPTWKDLLPTIKKTPGRARGGSK